MADGTREGSILAGKVAARALFVLAGLSLVFGPFLITGVLRLNCLRPWLELGVDVGSCLLFGGVLWWWAHSERDEISNKTGIGNPTVTMVVTVLTAVIAIFTFSHELFRAEPPNRPHVDSSAGRSPAGPTHSP